jgi:hypothetical protein
MGEDGTERGGPQLIKSNFHPGKSMRVAALIESVELRLKPISVLSIFVSPSICTTANLSIELRAEDFVPNSVQRIEAKPMEPTSCRDPGAACASGDTIAVRCIAPLKIISVGLHFKRRIVTFKGVTQLQF